MLRIADFFRLVDKEAPSSPHLGSTGLAHSMGSDGERSEIVNRATVQEQQRRGFKRELDRQIEGHALGLGKPRTRSPRRESEQKVRSR